MKALLQKNADSNISLITLDNEYFLNDDCEFATKLQFKFQNKTEISFIEIDENILKGLKFQPVNINEDLSTALFNSNLAIKNNITHIFTQKSQDENKINLKIVCEKITITQDVSPDSLLNVYELIKNNIIFFQKIECEHKLTKNDINLYANIDYILLDDLMVFLFNLDN